MKLAIALLLALTSHGQAQNFLDWSAEDIIPRDKDGLCCPWQNKQGLKANDLVCVIYTSLGRGSGVVVAKNKVITCAHVIQGVSIASCKIRAAGKEKTILGNVTYVDSASDVAIITLLKEVEAYAKIADEMPDIGEEVVCVGYPSFDQKIPICWKVSVNGVILRRKSAGMYLKGAVTPGQSGGGVFNSKGELVGIIQGGWKQHIYKRKVKDLPDKETELQYPIRCCSFNQFGFSRSDWKE